MSTETATQQPIERVLSLLKHPRRYSHGYSTHCPAHQDKRASLMVWEDEADNHVGMMCFRGCPRAAICEAIGITEEDLYVPGENRPKRDPSTIITSFGLGIDKHIHPHFLDNLGVRDDKRGVIIPYYTQDGKPYARYRLRTALKASDGSTWNIDSQEPIIPYGLQRLEDARKAGFLVIVEGESDCWTLWLHKFPALGIPGAQLHNCLQRQYLTGINRVYIGQESDEAGRAFAVGIEKRLQDIGYAGKVCILDMQETCQAKDPNELHKRSRIAFKETFQAALKQAAKSSGFTPDICSLRDLLKKTLPAPRWAIRELLIEGLSILAGRPKMGKSWMILQIALALATGGKALKKIDVECADVLYLALEDPHRRLQARAMQLLADDWRERLGCFDYATEWARLNEGGRDALEEWLEQHPQARLVVIDTLQKVRPRRTRNTDKYEDDYSDIAPLKELADKYHCAIVVIHHTRKAGASDPLDEVSGSTGLTGVVDSVFVLKRERGRADAVLHVSGRDIEERELAITFDEQTGDWTLAGDAEAFRLTWERQEIIDVLHDLIRQNVPTTPLKITEAINVGRETKKSRESVRYLLHKMTQAGDISPCNDVYTPNRPNSTNPPNVPTDSQEAPKSYSSGYGPDSADSHDRPVRGVSGNGQNGHKKEVPPQWLREGSWEWQKAVEKNGLADMQERRASWFAQQKGGEA